MVLVSWWLYSNLLKLFVKFDVEAAIYAPRTQCAKVYVLDRTQKLFSA
jgi:hypothetical protein